MKITLKAFLSLSSICVKDFTKNLILEKFLKLKPHKTNIEKTKSMKYF